MKNANTFAFFMFSGYLAPSCSHQHPLPVSPPPFHLPNTKNAPFVAHLPCSATILGLNMKNANTFTFFVFGGYPAHSHCHQHPSSPLSTPTYLCLSPPA